MDLAVIIGFVLGVSMVVFGIGLDALMNFFDVPSVLIVFGGGLGATMMATGMDELTGAVKTSMQMLLHKKHDLIPLVKRIVEFSEIARRDGILALENVTDQIKDEFLVKGIRLAVDGTDPELIESILTTEVSNIRKRHEKAKSFFLMFEKYAPGWGMIGTLIGLINMLSQGMDNPAVLTAGMAVALITTMYGSMISNFAVGPIGSKLTALDGEEMLAKSIVVKGVLAIQSGDNPRIVEMKLKIFLPPAVRNSFGKDAEGG
ncbi:motility protein A [Planctomycetales bacterium]|nr:motility protein A [Planctomycetales bacterium]GHS98697.1 motility protein A [Planctomycetales bacterium]